MKRFDILLTVVFCFLMFSAQAVILEDFKVIQNEELKIGNMLVWKTKADFDIDYYQVQKSKDGTSFENIGGEVAAQEKDFADYRFLDPYANKQSNYRLAMITKSGQTIYSEAITINRQLTNQLIITQISSFEVKSIFEMTYESREELEISYQLVDNKGKVLLTDKILTQKGLNKFIIPMTEYPKGYYTVLLRNGEEVEETNLLKL